MINATYISSSSFSVSGDRTAELHTKRKVRCYCDGVYLIGTISSSVYSSVTTVELDIDTLTSGLTFIEYGEISAENSSLPVHGHTDNTEGGTIYHANLLILESDDHLQYHTDARGDIRYYTKTEIDTLSGTLQDQIDEFTGVSGVITDHSDLDSLDYASSGHTGFQPSGDYITSTILTTTSGDIVSQIPADYISNSEMTTISGDIVSQIPSLTNYYTMSQVDTISGTINSNFANYTTTASMSDTGVTISGAASKLYAGVNHIDGADPLVPNLLFGTSATPTLSGNACPYGTIYYQYS